MSRIEEIRAIYKDSKSGWSYDIRELLEDIDRLREALQRSDNLVVNLRERVRELEGENK